MRQEPGYGGIHVVRSGDLYVRIWSNVGYCCVCLPRFIEMYIHRSNRLRHWSMKADAK